MSVGECMQFISLHSDLHQVIKTLNSKYEVAIKNDYVYNPIAWALCETWKYYDIKGGDSE